MTASVFLDTNILLYALVPASASVQDPRTETAERLLADGGTISVQVLHEFCDVAHRKLGKSWAAIRELVGAVGDLCAPAIPLTSEVLAAAVEISNRYQFR